MPSDLYKSTAYYYARYRPFYTHEEIKDIVQLFSLNKNDRILDIGAGTGQLAIQLAPYVQEVVAIEPEAETIKEGKWLAKEHQVNNITWIQARAEDISKTPSLGLFKIATFGTSFHWLDQDRVLKSLEAIIKKEGGIVITGSPSVWNSKESLDMKIKEIIQKYLGKDRRAGSGTFKKTLNKEHTYEKILQRSAFHKVEEENYSIDRTYTIDEIVGHVFSTSFASPVILANKKDLFEEDLRSTLKALSTTGSFTKNESYFVIFAKR